MSAQKGVRWAFWALIVAPFGAAAIAVGLLTRRS